MIKEEIEEGKIKRLGVFKANVTNDGRLNVYVPVLNEKPDLVENFERLLSAIGWEKNVYLKKGGSFDKLTDGKVKKSDLGFKLYHREYIYTTGIAFI